MEENIITFVGRNGTIFNPFSGYNPLFTGVKPTPIIEIDSNFGGEKDFYVIDTGDYPAFSKILAEAEKIYKQWGKFGIYGDVIAVSYYQTENRLICHVDYIGHKENS